MSNQTVFQRREIKYLLTKQQKNEIKILMDNYMGKDEHGRSTICNVYFDTSNNLLIRRSIEKPIYKEKIRIRSYGIATPDSEVFVELKRKHKSIVYKRRISLKEEDAMKYTTNQSGIVKSTQISREIDYFLSIYDELNPKVFLSYEREAFYANNDHNLRVTFDENILWRDYDLSLCDGIYGNDILPENMALMEIKTAVAIPLWMTRILTKYKLYKSSFSKYGNAYKQILLRKGA